LKDKIFKIDQENDKLKSQYLSELNNNIIKKKSPDKDDELVDKKEYKQN
jgi:hypothetical protein